MNAAFQRYRIRLTDREHFPLKQWKIYNSQIHRLNEYIDTDGLCVYAIRGKMPKFAQIPEKLEADNIENSKKLQWNNQTTDDIGIPPPEARRGLKKYHTTRGKYNSVF